MGSFNDLKNKLFGGGDAKKPPEDFDLVLSDSDGEQMVFGNVNPDATMSGPAWDRPIRDEHDIYVNSAVTREKVFDGREHEPSVFIENSTGYMHIKGQDIDEPGEELVMGLAPIEPEM